MSFTFAEATIEGGSRTELAPGLIEVCHEHDTDFVWCIQNTARRSFNLTYKLPDCKGAFGACDNSGETKKRADLSSPAAGDNFLGFEINVPAATSENPVVLFNAFAVCADPELEAEEGFFCGFANPTIVPGPEDPSAVAERIQKLRDEVLPEKIKEAVTKAFPALGEDPDAKHPAVVVGISTGDDDILSLSAFGYSDIEGGVKASAEESVFDLASCSKHFAGFFIARCVEQGLFQLNSPVTDVVPEFAPQQVDGDRTILIQDLLWHICPVPDYTGEDGPEGEEFEQLGTEKLLLWVNSIPMKSKTGIKYSYNNSGYALLTLIIERAKKKSYRQVLADELFEPAGVDSKIAYSMDSLIVRDERTPPTVKPYAVAEGGGEFKIDRLDVCVGGDGNIFVSPAQFLKVWKYFRSGKFFSQKTFDDIVCRAGILDSGELPDGESYGAGVNISPGETLGHSGSWMGTSTEFKAAIGKKNGQVVVFANLGDKNDQVSEILETVYEAACVGFRDWVNPFSSSTSNSATAAATAAAGGGGEGDENVIPEAEEGSLSAAELNAVFDQFDIDGSNYLEKSECFAAIVHYLPSASPARVSELVKEADSNQDNQLSRAEFGRMVRKLVAEGEQEGDDADYDEEEDY